MAAATRRRDWFRILRDLMRAGVSMSYVARKCGRTTTTVENWAEGGDPKDADARVVLALYARHCPVQYAEHAKVFDIKVEIEKITGPGDNRALPFVG